MTVKGRVVDIQATDKQRLAWQAWQNPLVDDVILGGGAGGGKSIWLGQVLTGSALSYPGTKYFLGRNELKTLMQTTYITLTQKVFPAYGLTEKDWYLDGKYNVIHFKNGSSLDLLDVKNNPSDPLFDRFGSSEYTQGGGDELSEWPFKAYDVLKSRVGRWKNQEMNIKSKFGGTLNPSQDWPYRMFYKPWVTSGRPLDPNKPLVSMRAMVDGEEVTRTFVFIQSLYKDNPFLTRDYITNLATISDQVLKSRLMEGDWDYADAADTLFDAASIADIFTNAPNPSEELFMTVDMARFGGDKIVRTIWKGWDAFRIKHKVNVSVTQTADDVRTDMVTYGIPHSNVLYDDDGVGGSLGDLVPGIIAFNGGSAPFGVVGEKEIKENYENLKTQCIYHLSQQARARKVKVSEPDIQIREEVAQDLQQFKRRDAQLDGKLKVAKKEDQKAALGRSPDIGDTLMMRSYFDLRKRDENLGFGSRTMEVFIPEL